jgi:hypothetical protein
MKCSLAWRNQISPHASIPLINEKFRGGNFVQLKLRVRRDQKPVPEPTLDPYKLNKEPEQTP